MDTIDNKTAADFAAPHHQEMNGLCEVTWRTIDTMARTMRTHARLGNHFFGHSIQYASYVLNRLCPKGLMDASGKATTPFFMAFGRKPCVGHLRVFGCPVTFKRYNAKAPDKRLTKKQQPQRASARAPVLEAY